MNQTPFEMSQETFPEWSGDDTLCAMFQGSSEYPRNSAFVDECRETLQRLRAVLIEALGEAGADPTHPREAGRVLGLDKSLMWRLSKIVSQPDVFQEVGNLPHKAGALILLKALAKADVRRSTVDRLAGAFDSLEALVERHAGDRATFELVAGGFGAMESQAHTLEQGRKLAFRGNSAVWSAQARVQVSTAIMAPNADDPELVDMVHVYGLVDLRRLRDDVRWTLSRRQVFDDAATNVQRESGEPLEDAPGAVDDILLRPFSSAPFPRLIVEEHGDELHYVLPEGHVGKTGEVTALFGSYHQAIGSQRATATDQFGQMVISMFTPTEHLHFDMLVHKDLDWAMQPRAGVFGGMDGKPYHLGSSHPGVKLPFSESVVDLGPGIAATATPRMPWYGELLDWVFTRRGLDPAEFRAFRFEMAYPPIPAYAILYSELLPATGVADQNGQGAEATHSSPSDGASS